MLGFCNCFGKLRHLFEFGFGIIFRCIFPVQDVHIEISKTNFIEKQSLCTVGQFKVQIGTNPVDNRHKVIHNCFNACFPQVAKTFAIILKQSFSVGTSELNTFGHGQTFHHRPTQAETFDIVFQFGNGFVSPYIAIWHIVQSSYNALHSYLPKHIQCDPVFSAEPSPRFFHSIFFI